MEDADVASVDVGSSVVTAKDKGEPPKTGTATVRFWNIFSETFWNILEHFCRDILEINFKLVLHRFKINEQNESLFFTSIHFSEINI